jgi:AcrR family transcriptional regulator
MPKYVDHARRRADLAAAFWRVVDREGADKTTIARVAAEAGVSVGTVQHYFSDKDELFWFAFQRTQEEYRSRLARRLAALPTPLAPRAALFEILLLRLPLTAKQQRRALVLQYGLSRHGARSRLSELLVERVEFSNDTLADHIRAGQAQGHVAAEVDPMLAAGNLLALDEGLILGLLFGVHTRASVVQLINAQLDLLFAGEPQAKTAIAKALVVEGARRTNVRHGRKAGAHRRGRGY